MTHTYFDNNKLPLKFALCVLEGHVKMNGHSRSHERQRRRPCSDSDQEPSQGSDASENESSSSVSRRPRARKTAMAAVNKMKLLDILEDDEGSDEEGRGGSTRPVTRARQTLCCHSEQF